MAHLLWLWISLIIFMELTHVIVGIFEIHNRIDTIISNLIKVLFNNKNYVKKRFNFKTLTNTLINIVSCYPFQLPIQFIGSCFCHVMPKVIQYNINDVKV